MINLMVGNNFEDSLLDGYIELNSKSDEVKITEMFGSIKNDPIGCAREEDRLPIFDFDKLSVFISKANSNSIKVNYTINKSCIGSIEDFKDRKEKSFYNFIKLLANQKWK